MEKIIADAAMLDKSQVEENRGFSEESVEPERQPRNWEEGFTMVENKILSQGRYLSADAKVTYMTLKSFENAKTKLCYPSYDKIIERSGLTRPRLADALGELQDFCWLTKKKRFSGSTYYTLVTPVVWQLDENRNHIGLFHDQTCPRKEQAREWSRMLHVKKKRRGGGWNDKVRAENRKIEDEEAEDEEIPF